MAQKQKRTKIVIILFIFVIYFFVAARPVPKEAVLTLNWINSVSGAEVLQKTDDEPALSSFDNLLPFTLGDRFGYVDPSGQFVLNKIKRNDIYLSHNMWTEYSAEPSSIVLGNIADNSQITIENTRGYPILLDNRIFIFGSEQNSISEIDVFQNTLWTYEFGAPLTAFDAAAGLVLTGSLDGVMEVFNSAGERIFYFEPSGSRYSVILGCALSRNGSRIAVVCGIDRQRFLIFERLPGSVGEYKIIYHEFLETGFRRPVRVLFVDNDQRIVFEYEGGLGVYNIKSRRVVHIPLEGSITAIDQSGERGFLFLITSHSESQKKLTGIRFPPDNLLGISSSPECMIFMKAPFSSDNIFLGRSGGENISSQLVIGGGTALISFNLEEK